MEKELDILKNALRVQIPGVVKEAGVTVQAIYTFGSTGTSYFRPDSDVDVAILGDRAMSVKEKMDILQNITLPGAHSLDLLDMRAVDLEMQHIVLSAHGRIYVNAAYQDEVEDYEDRVWVIYITLCDDRKPIIDEIKRTGVIYGPDYSPKSRLRSKAHQAH